MDTRSVCTHKEPHDYWEGEIVLGQSHSLHATGPARGRGRYQYRMCALCWPTREAAIDALMATAEDIRIRSMADEQLLAAILTGSDSAFQGAEELIGDTTFEGWDK